jgi:flagellar protein FlaG
MGASVSASHMIFFVAAIVAAGVIGTTIIGVSFIISEDLGDRTEDLSSEFATSITIANDPREVPYVDGQLIIYVLNGGRQVIDPGELLVLLDGMVVEYTPVPGPGSGVGWSAGKMMQLYIEFEWPIGSGDHIITVTTENGATDQLGFRT